MKKTFLAVVLSVMPIVAVAQNATKTDAAPKPPAIDAELRAAYFQALASKQQTAANDQAATATLNAAYQAMVKACGEGYQVTGGGNGQPICTPNPKPTPSPTPPVKPIEKGQK